MADLYAWSEIRNGKDVVKVGEKVSAAKVGGEDTLKQFQADGIVRPYPYPDNGTGQSPVDYLREQVAKQSEDEAGKLVQQLQAAKSDGVPSELAGTVGGLGNQ